jgi:hypothetical protein
LPLPLYRAQPGRPPELRQPATSRSSGVTGTWSLCAVLWPELPLTPRPLRTEDAAEQETVYGRCERSCPAVYDRLEPQRGFVRGVAPSTNRHSARSPTESTADDRHGRALFRWFLGATHLTWAMDSPATPGWRSAARRPNDVRAASCGTVNVSTSDARATTRKIRVICKPDPVIAQTSGVVFSCGT